MKNLQEKSALALQALIQNGATMATAKAGQTSLNELNAAQGEITLYRSTQDKQLSLSAVIKGKRGTLALNSLEEDAVLSSAADCALSALNSQEDEAWGLAPKAEADFDQGCFTPDMDKLLMRTVELMDTIREEYPKVVVEEMTTSHTAFESVYRNSNGACFTSKGGAYAVSLMISGHEGEKTSSFNAAALSLTDLERPFIEAGALRRVLRDAEKQIHTRRLQGKFTGSVVFTPDCLSDILRELISNYASDGVLIDGTSRWKDALHTRVADPRITLSVSPLDSRLTLGERYTSEGFVSEDYRLIDHGVLNSFMLSLYGANKTSKPRALNSASSLVMEAGDQPLKDLISGIERGLLVGRYSGGAANANGEFSGVAKNSFLIENGQVKEAVSEAMIQGNLALMLQNLRGLSLETECDGSNVLPYMAVDGITISGQ